MAMRTLATDNELGYVKRRSHTVMCAASATHG